MSFVEWLKREAFGEEPSPRHKRMWQERYGNDPSAVPPTAPVVIPRAKFPFTTRTTNELTADEQAREIAVRIDNAYELFRLQIMKSLDAEAAVEFAANVNPETGRKFRRLLAELDLETNERLRRYLG